MTKPAFADTGDDDVNTARVKGDVGVGLCWRGPMCGRGLYVHSPRCVSLCRTVGRENRGYTNREMGKPMVISHRTPYYNMNKG